MEELLNLLPVLAVLDCRLKVRVAADMLLPDKDVGDGALARDLEQRTLNVIAICLLVELVVRVLGAISVEESLGVVTVRAVRLAENDCGETRTFISICFSVLKDFLP